MLVLNGTTGVNKVQDGSIYPEDLVQKMTLMTAVTASGTSIDFTGIPSWAKRITVMFNAVSTNGVSHRLIQLGESGGVVTTSYSSVSSYSGQVGGTSSTIGFNIYSDIATRIHSGVYTFHLLGNNSWVGNSVIAQTDTGYTMQSSGSKTLSSELTTVRITTVNGTDTFDAGTINIMYEG